jgi:hypothetical protein
MERDGKFLVGAWQQATLIWYDYLSSFEVNSLLQHDYFIFHEVWRKSYASK